MSVLDDSELKTDQGGDSGGSPPRNEEIEGLRAALQAERAKRKANDTAVAELRAKVDELSQKPVKEYTRAELQSFVDDGRMSQGEADRILDEQTQRKIEKNVSQKIESQNTLKEVQARIGSEIDKYTDAYPDVLRDGSENRRLVAEEYQRQLSLGKPDNLQTELDALMTVFGPSNRLQKGREKQPETHQDVGSDGGGDPPKSGAPKLPSHVRTHYEKMIEKGMYKGWDDPALKAEVETYKRPGW